MPYFLFFESYFYFVQGFLKIFAEAGVVYRLFIEFESQELGYYSLRKANCEKIDENSEKNDFQLGELFVCLF